MSYLKEIIKAKGITMHDLAEMTGNAYSCITVMLKNDSYAFSHKKTQKKIADALGFEEVTSRSKLQRARARLQEMIKEKY